MTTLRRPAHVDLGDLPYFVTTRTHKSGLVFRGLAAQAAVDQLIDERQRYGFLLMAFVFMPDHAHFVIVPARGFTISQTMRVVKGAISRKINLLRAKTGPVWQDGFRDNAARDNRELHNYITYTHNNPVKAGLCVQAESYPSSSADGRCDADYQTYFERERE